MSDKICEEGMRYEVRIDLCFSFNLVVFICLVVFVCLVVSLRLVVLHSLVVARLLVVSSIMFRQIVVLDL